MRRVAKEKRDVVKEFIKILNKRKIPFCIIGGLAVNAYSEPVVSLDLDIVIIAEELDNLLTALKQEYKIKKFKNSINVTSKFSDVRIQIQTDQRYQDFIQRSIRKEVLGYLLPVAAIEDVMQGKIWAGQDKTRRASKRQKDLADILRLIERKKSLLLLVPDSLREKLLL